MKHMFIFMIALFGFSSVLFAFEEPLKDVVQEQRAKEIFANLKCVECAGQSVLDSDSDFAKSVRQLVRDRLSAGMNAEQIYDLMRNNYGDQILYDPPFNDKTALLWLLPFVLIFFGFIMVIVVLRKGKHEFVHQEQM